MAVYALHQSLVHPVMERPRKLLLGLQMAAVAQRRLLFLHQKLALLRMVRVVTIRTSHTVLQVRRSSIVAVLLPVLVAVQAPRADVRGRSILERENLGFVAPALHVRFARPVASFAAVPFRTPFSVQRGGVVRRRLIILEEILRWHVLVAGFAGLRADIQG